MVRQRGAAQSQTVLWTISHSSKLLRRMTRWRGHKGPDCRQINLQGGDRTSVFWSFIISLDDLLCTALGAPAFSSWCFPSTAQGLEPSWDGESPPAAQEDMGGSCSQVSFQDIFLLKLVWFYEYLPRSSRDSFISLQISDYPPDTTAFHANSPYYWNIINSNRCGAYQKYRENSKYVLIETHF